MPEQTVTASIVEDLALFCLQGGPQTSSAVARLLGVDNQVALKYLRAQIASGFVLERTVNGSRVFELFDTRAGDLRLDD